MRIVHSANHRGAKGTDFLVAAVEQLRAEGHDLELDLIERVPNSEAVARVAAADMYVDQLLFGYAMAALEAMALGKVVISGIEDTPDYQLFRRYSYLDECPIVPGVAGDGRRRAARADRRSGALAGDRPRVARLRRALALLRGSGRAVRRDLPPRLARRRRST